MKKTLTLILIFFLFACGEKQDTNKPEIKFTEQPSGSGASFRGLSVVDKNTAWVTGSSGTILKTRNAGSSWEKIIIPAAGESGFRDVHAWSADEALVMGIASPALFYKTSDGGKTWREVYRNDDERMFFDSIEFWNDKNGLAFGDPINGRFFLLKTTDAGENWFPIDTLGIPVSPEGEGGFAASGTCIATVGDSLAWFVSGGSLARVFITSDQGKNWQVVNSPIINGLASTGIFSVCFADGKNGVIVGGDYRNDRENNANAAISNDGGKDWRLLDPGKPNGFKSCAEFFPGDANIIITTGTSGTDISFNNGESWSYIDSTSYNTIGFASGSNFGWAVGDEGRISRIVIK